MSSDRMEEEGGYRAVAFPLAGSLLKLSSRIELIALIVDSRDMATVF